MNIAFLTKEYHPSTVDAGFTTVLSLAKEMKKQGHTVVMISGRQKYTENERILPADKKMEFADGIPIYRQYYLPWFNTKFWFFDASLFFNRFFAGPWGVRYVQNELGIVFDIIHSFSSSPGVALNCIFASFFSRSSKKVHTIKSFCLYDAHIFKIGNNLATKLLNFCDSIITSLQLLKKELVANGCNSDKIYIINSPINLDKIVKKDKTILRKRYGFSIGDKLILYYGNRVPSKGTDIILDCVDYLPSDKNTKILMIHPTIWPDSYKEHLAQKKNGNIIKLIVEKIDVVDYLSMADLVILPYRNLKSTEANPLCLLEAMACKTPVVTTSIPEIKELVTDRKDVLMANPEDPKSLAEKIMELLNNPDLQKALVENAYQTVQKFDIKLIAKQHLELYERLLNKNS